MFLLLFYPKSLSVTKSSTASAIFTNLVKYALIGASCLKENIFAKVNKADGNSGHLSHKPQVL